MTIYSRQSKLVLQPHLSSSTTIIHQETRAKEGAVWLWEGNRNWSLVIVGSLVWIWPVRLTLLKSCANKGTGFQLTQLESLLWRLFFPTTPSESLQLAPHLQQMEDVCCTWVAFSFKLLFSSKSSFIISIIPDTVNKQLIWLLTTLVPLI